MTELFLLVGAPFESSLRLLWPDPDPDSGRSDPVMLEAEMDSWDGDEVLDAVHPWLLMTDSTWHVIADAGLTGLHAVSLPTLQFSEIGAVRAHLGEFAVRDLPPFCLVRPERSIRVANQEGDENSWTTGDDLRYWDWSGDDFSQSRLGAVVTECARSVLLARHIPNSTFFLVRPRWYT